MLLKIEGVLDAGHLARFRERLDACDWVDGNATSGPISAKAKHNLQVLDATAVTSELGGIILDRLGRHPAFLSAALPLKVIPPLFNRYDVGMGFGDHVDNAIRQTSDGRRYRTDLSCTVFLSDPGDYDGGALVVTGVFGQQSVKFSAGDAVLYPASSVHHVTPVTRGRRLASFFWIQSMVRDDGQRTLLYELDQAIIGARASLGDDHPSLAGLTSTYHNLIRRWADA